MLFVTTNEDTERWQLFEQVVNGCSEDFLKQAGLWFFHEAKLRFAIMPWEEAVPAMEAEQKQTGKKPKAKKVSLSELLAKNKGYVNPCGEIELNNDIDLNIPDWVPLAQTPLLKSKGYDPISLHLKHGMHVLYKSKLGGAAAGKITGFTKLYVKLKADESGQEGKVTYNQITHINTSHV